MNKKGAETTIGTIVVVILAILVLVVVAAGFAMGWNNLWKRTLNIFTPAAEGIDAIAAKCDAMCLTNQKYSYCCEPQTVNIKGTVFKDKSCDRLKNEKTNGIKLPITCETISCEGVC